MVISCLVQNKQNQSVVDYSKILQLGMTLPEVERIKGTPKFIDEINDNNYFQMWTYQSNFKTTRLYFEKNK